MKIPEEIKRGLEMCAETCFVCPAECPYMMTACSQGDKVMADALAYIQQLEQDNAQKDERIRKLEREREALMEDFRVYRERIIKQESGVYACDLCKHGGKFEKIEDITCPEGCDGIGHWEWRGVEEEE